MKIAITADVHLSSYEETPERYHAVKDILQQAVSASLDAVLICGDLFHQDFNNYKDFENLAKDFQKMEIWILPGNHDARVSSRSLTGKNLRIFEKAEIVEGDIPFLMVPYQAGITMGDVIAGHVKSLSPKNWVLCGHGDWMEGVRIPNPMESGIYMPLTRTDLERYMPYQVFLGHIHAKMDGSVHYAGSPCGIDITETGERRFLVFDTSTGNVESKPVNTDRVFQNANLLILPVEDEAAYVRKLISDEKLKWKIQNEKDIARTTIRVKIRGYTRDKTALNDLVTQEFEGFSFYKEEEPDLSGVSVVWDQSRIKIAELVKEKIKSLELNSSPDEPDRDLVLMKSLSLVFEG